MEYELSLNITQYFLRIQNIDNNLVSKIGVILVHVLFLFIVWQLVFVGIDEAAFFATKCLLVFVSLCF